MDGMIELVWDDPNQSSISTCPQDYHCAELEFCQEGNDVFGFRLPDTTTCGELAPLITMEAGNDYYLLLHNAASDGEPANIHTHGLHISGDGNADDVTRKAQPGECLAYYWEIPEDHMAGTFWYHAHVHGHTNDHVEGGAFGMIDLVAPITHDGGTQVDDWLDSSQEILLVAAKKGNTLYGNGIEGGPTFTLTKNEWYRIRVSTVDADANPQEFVIPSQCDAHAVAHDGVFRFDLPKLSSENIYMLTGASRIDLAVKCTDEGTFDVQFGGTNDNDVVARFSVSNGTPSNASPWKDGVANGQWQIVTRPSYLLNLRDPLNVDQEISIKLTGGQVNAEFEGQDVGHEWDPNNSIAEMGYDKLTELTIRSSNHPFHLHVYHMQIVTQGGCGGIFEEGEYFDVVSPEVQDCKVRFKTLDIGGRVVFHCHILQHQHEDNGDMGWLDITWNYPAPGMDQVDAMSCGGGGGGGGGGPGTGCPVACNNHDECKDNCLFKRSCRQGACE